MNQSILLVLLGIAGMAYAVWALTYERRHDSSKKTRRSFIDRLTDMAYLDFTAVLGIYFWFGLCAGWIVMGIRAI